MTSIPVRPSLADVSALPHVALTPAELDDDVVRTMLSAGLTFSRADRDLNVRRTGTSRPRSAGTADWRSAARSPRTPRRARTWERRDRKGLYAKARAGLIPEFNGISDPYGPTDADLVIDTTNVPVDEAVERVLTLLVT